jgi:hypothetical protein
LQEKVKLKTALELFSDMTKGKLTIVIVKNAFIEDIGPDVPDPYEEEVESCLRCRRRCLEYGLTADSGAGRDRQGDLHDPARIFIEITTTDRYLADKGLRIYPIGYLTMPSGAAASPGGAGGIGGVGGVLWRVAAWAWAAMGMMGMGGGGMMGMGRHGWHGRHHGYGRHGWHGPEWLAWAA